MTATFTGLETGRGGATAGKESQSSAFDPLLPRPIRVRILRQGEIPRWLPYVLRRLNDLASRYGEEPTEESVLADPRALERSLHVLGALIDDTTPAPSVVPTLHGGVQFVWHRGGWDVEIEVFSSHTVLWGRKRETGEEFEGAPELNREALARALHQIEASPGNRG